MELENKERFIFIISAENTKSTTSDGFLNWKDNTKNKPLYTYVITCPDIYGFIFSINPITEKDFEEIKHTEF